MSVYGEADAGVLVLVRAGGAITYVIWRAYLWCGSSEVLEISLSMEDSWLSRAKFSYDLNLSA